MRQTTKHAHRHHRPDSPAIDPYVVQHTWTREELLQARGIPVRKARRRTNSGPHRKAA